MATVPLFIWASVARPGLVAILLAFAALARPAAVLADTDLPGVRFRFDAGAPLLAPAGAAPDGTVCVGTVDGYVHLLGPDGSYRWSYSVHGAVARRPLFAGKLWYIATSAERIYALTRAGALYWVFKPPSSIASELAVDSGLLYFAASDGFLYGVTEHGGISLRAQFGILSAGPKADAGAAIWLENVAGVRLRVRGRTVRRYAITEPRELEFDALNTLQDPEGRRWSAAATGVLTVSGALFEPITRLITRSPLFTPAWSEGAHYAVVSARNGLVVALEPPRPRPS